MTMDEGGKASKCNKAGKMAKYRISEWAMKGQYRRRKRKQAIDYKMWKNQ